MDIQIRKQLEQLEYIKDKLEYIEYDKALGCYIEKQDGLPTGVAAWVNGAFYGFEQAAKAQSVQETLKNDCMIGQTWFMKGTSVSALIKHAEDIYKAEVVAQNSKIEFGTDDNEHWFAHDVPFYGRVQIDRIEEHGLVEWDIFFNECWQGPFGSKSECIKHLEECIADEREEAQEQKG